MANAPIDSRGFFLPPHRIEAISDAANKVIKTIMGYRLTLNKAEMELALVTAITIINLGEDAGGIHEDNQN